MAEQQDKDSRTEKATDKRLKDAAEEGNVPVSREAANLAFLLTAVAALLYLAGPVASRLTQMLSGFIANASDIRIAAKSDVLRLFEVMGAEWLIPGLSIPILFAAAGVAVACLQNVPSPVWKRVAPDFSRVSPSKGLKRLTGSSGLFEFFKTTLRFWMVVCVLGYVIVDRWTEFGDTVWKDAANIPGVANDLAIALLMSAAAPGVVLLVFDLPVTRLLWLKSLRMSPNEIKDERKEIDGDQQIKARRRSIARARVRRRLTSDVGRATLVVANPTHFAVALRYVREEGGAPKVVAKGQDIIALTIRRIAEERGIPVVEDKALARSLYQKVSVDQMIPVEFYRVIAEIVIKLQARSGLAGARR
ncbi:MAG: EscU/YscU/HrcU family type III secretion system export apparatus switch protein [Hyphomicrobium sp.]